MSGERDLLGLSRHVLYEFEMVEALAKRLVDVTMKAPQPAWRERFETTEADTRPAWFVENAMVESLLIHARSLVEFLFDEGQRQADAAAQDYIDGADVHAWLEVRGEEPPPALAREALRQPVGQEVAHLTWPRASLVDTGRPWHMYDIYGALAELMERYAEYVRQDRVCEGFTGRVKAALPRRQPPAPKHHRPGTWSARPG